MLLIVTTSIFGAASLGGLASGLIDQMFAKKGNLPMILRWAISGFIGGLSLAIVLQVLPPFPQGGGISKGWLQLAVVLAGLVLGLALGANFANAMKIDEQARDVDRES